MASLSGSSGNGSLQTGTISSVNPVFLYRSYDTIYGTDRDDWWTRSIDHHRVDFYITVSGNKDFKIGDTVILINGADTVSLAGQLSLDYGASAYSASYDGSNAIINGHRYNFVTTSWTPNPYAWNTSRATITTPGMIAVVSDSRAIAF